jgi:hypothetical protein
MPTLYLGSPSFIAPFLSFIVHTKDLPGAPPERNELIHLCELVRSLLAHAGRMILHHHYILLQISGRWSGGLELD